MGTSSRACSMRAMCQGPGVTVVALVDSDVTGVVTNTAAVDSIDNVDGLPVSTTATTTVNASATLNISKVALNDPAYAGGVALYYSRPRTPYQR